MALTVKLIYGTRIRNDVMDGVELDDVKLRNIEKSAENQAFENLWYHEISQSAPNYRYVDDISILVKVQISWLEIVKSSKS